MSYITFKQAQLTNLAFSTQHEILRTNRAGAYMATTLSDCNTRKYHGLLIAPIENFGGEKHVLLSQLDETIIQRKTEFPLAVRQFKNKYFEPKGNKFFYSFEYEKTPKYIYRAGGVKLMKERLLVENEQSILIKYTLLEAGSPVLLQLRPFVAFRNIHQLSKANPYAQTGYEELPNGIRMQLYDYYPWLNMQLNKKPVFVESPDWYYDVEYQKEKNRGYESLEDLFTPGYFQVDIKVGESIVFSASTQEIKTSKLKQKFASELRKRPYQDNFEDSLKNAAMQFIWHRGEKEDIIAGFPWYNSISHQTFIALPGLRLIQSDRRLGIEVLQNYQSYLKDGLLPRSICDKHLKYESADASLWFIWALQQLYRQGVRIKELGSIFGDSIKEILSSYRQGTKIVNMLESGLLFSAEQGQTFTWMDSYTNGVPAVPRYGMPVELNALWYNAICFALDCAHRAGDTEFIQEWKHMPEKIEEAFIKAYWNEEKGYLADVYNGFHTDWSIRPNMVIAVALPYTPISKEIRLKIINTAKQHLLTPRGLRTLSPEDPAYKPVVLGNVPQREAAAHNGAVHPWLLQFYAEAYLGLHKKSGVSHIKSIIKGFHDEMRENCIGTISEMYNGDPPHAGKGAVSQAWNVAALLYCMNLVEQTEKQP